MSDKNPIDEKKFDELLRDLYLEENSKRQNDKEAEHVFRQQYDVKMSPQKEKDFLIKLRGGKSGFGYFRFFLSVFVIAVALAVFFWEIREKRESKNTSRIPISEKPAGHIFEIPSVNKDTFLRLPGKNYDLLKIADTFGQTRIIAFVIPETDSTGNIAKESSKSVNSNTPDSSSIPLLSEKDRLRYLKIKDEMLSKLIMSEKGIYTLVPPDKVLISGSTITLDAFTIRSVAVTNLEYKTFLADLLIKKKEEDYLKAQVFPEGWMDFHCYNLANSYFQDEKYNDFPVVNMPLEGAILFCRWLEEEGNFFIQKNSMKSKVLQIRLPFVEEMIRAARDGYARFAYEKGYNTIYDLEEKLVDNSFSGRAETIKKRASKSDTLYSILVTNKYGWNEREISDFFNAGLNYYNTQPSDTLFSERMKVFGKIGRVSELVMQKNTSKIWLAGQSWKSKEEYLKFEEEFKNKLVSPFVGFRPIIIFNDAPSYKNPFW